MSDSNDPKKKFSITGAMGILGEANKVIEIMNEPFDEKELMLEEKKKKLEQLKKQQESLWSQVGNIPNEESNTDVFKMLLSTNEEKVRLEEEIKEAVREAKSKHTKKKVIRAIKNGSEHILPKILEFFE